MEASPSGKISSKLVVHFLRNTGSIKNEREASPQRNNHYTKEKKEKSPIIGVITTVYWLSVTAIYLAITLPTRNWQEGWIVWVIAAVLFPGIIAIVNVLKKSKS